MHALLLAIAAAASSGAAPTQPAADAGIYMFETGDSLRAKCRNNLRFRLHPVAASTHPHS